MAQFRDKFNNLEKSARSVFVGNISYDVTEEQIRQVFAKVGSVVHFRLVHDRETGRPKGFGFCEFTDSTMADMAIRNYNGYELNGRPLRVDSAASSDRNMEEAQQIQAAQQANKDQVFHQTEESPYGKEPEPGKAPEAIAKAVSAMPPEQMFDLMNQMKQTVTSSPAQTRQLLQENPQLAYALLQAQVVMRVVDPKVAYSMLHREVPTTQQPFHQQQSPNTTPMFNNAGPPSSAQHTYRPSGSGGPPSSNLNVGGPPPPSQMPPYQGAMPPPSQYGAPPRFSGTMNNMPTPSHQIASLPQSSTTSAQDDQTAQAQMLIRVINLTDEQIALLSDEERPMVLELRNQLRNRVGTNHT